MLTKIFFLLGLILLASSYTEENHVLILTADDLPSVTEEFQYILVEFYAPWCGHCKKLAPVYDEVAKELLDAGSPVRVAKIDADEHSSVKSTYGVQGFPTLIFFHKGQQIKYNGQRSKDFMVNWLTKKTRPAVVEIEADQLSELSTNGKVNVVLHGEVDSEQGKVLQEIAAADDYNTYYAVRGSDKAQGTFEIYRSFGETQSTDSTEGLKEWIAKFERPVVYPFDDRTIGNIFGDRGVGVVLFHSAEAGEALSQAFTDAATEIRINRGQSLIFTDIPTTGEHYHGLANYIKIQAAKSPIVIIDGGKRAKQVLFGAPADITSDNIIAFVEKFNNGNGNEYKLDEEITYDDGTKVEEEL